MNSIKKYAADEIIVREGENTACMYSVISGRVVLYLNYGTKDELLLGIVAKNKIFGELSLTAASPSLYTAVAYDDVTLMEITKDILGSFIESNPHAAIGIINNLSGINSILRKNIDLLLREVQDNADDATRQNELRKNLARYSVRGIDAYIAGTL